MAKKKKKKQSKKELIKKIIIKISISIIMLSLIFLSLIGLPKNESEFFEYDGVMWRTVIYDGEITYFPDNYLKEKSEFHLFLRIDPRENNIETFINSSTFTDLGYVSLSPEVASCERETKRAIEEMEMFLEEKTNLMEIKPATTDASLALEINDTAFYQKCFTSFRTSIISIELGDSSVKQRKESPYCYEIKINNCSDIAPIEKFITKIIKEEM